MEFQFSVSLLPQLIEHENNKCWTTRFTVLLQYNVFILAFLLYNINIVLVIILFKHIFNYNM